MPAPQRRRAAPTRPSGRAKGDRKRALLASAKKLFLARGFQNTTFADIAKDASVSEAIVLGHFEDKKAVFLEVLREVRGATLDRWQEPAEAVADPQTRLHSVAERFFLTAREQAAELRLLYRALLEVDDKAIAAFLGALYREAEDFLAGLIRDGQRAGVFRRNLDPRVGAWELIHTALGYALTLPLDLPLYRDADFSAHAVECVLQGLLKTDI
jgi:AcrR family transcriptional regulator